MFSYRHVCAPHSFLTSSPVILPSSPLPFFFFNDTATTEIYTLSLHDALPILHARTHQARRRGGRARGHQDALRGREARSEEHTSELQSRSDLVCRLLLEKKKHSQAISTHPRITGASTPITAA